MGLWAEFGSSLETGVNPRSGAPCTPRSPQVEGCGQQFPFGSDIVNPTQQEPSRLLLLLDDSEDGFDQLLSHLESYLSFVSSHPGTMNAQGRIMGAYHQAPSARTICNARRHDRTCLAIELGGPIPSPILFPAVLAAYQTQHLSLWAPVRLTAGVVGELVLVVGMVLCLTFRRLRHRYLLTAVSRFL